VFPDTIPRQYRIEEDRFDARCFTRLTREVHKFDAPFDANWQLRVLFSDLEKSPTRAQNPAVASG